MDTAPIYSPYNCIDWVVGRVLRLFYFIGVVWCWYLHIIESKRCLSNDKQIWPIFDELMWYLCSAVSWWTVGSFRAPVQSHPYCDCKPVPRSRDVHNQPLPSGYVHPLQAHRLNIQNDTSIRLIVLLINTHKLESWSKELIPCHVWSADQQIMDSITERWF